MANIADTTSEKSNNFVEGAYDPDLESRLYAEIYYSNESYVTPESELRKENNDASIPNINSNVSCLTSDPLSSSEIVNSAANFMCLTNQTQAAAFVEDARPKYHRFTGTRNIETRHLRKDWVFGGLRPPNGSEHQTVNKNTRRQRLLACKNLWVTPERREVRQEINKHSTAPIDSRENTLAANPFYNNSNIVRQINTPAVDVSRSKKKSGKDANHANSSSILNERSLPEKPRKKKKKEKRLKAICFRQVGHIRRPTDDVNFASRFPNISKYKVVAKKKKMATEVTDSEPVSISSDSDESILEVPVPPKTPPPVINLNDSDEECSKLSAAPIDINAESKNAAVPYYSIQSESSDSTESSASEGASNEPNTNSTNLTEHPADSACETETTNLILNCTDVQHGVANLDEIRKIKEAVGISHAHSDNSMTESEAMNWNNIAADQANSAKDKGIHSVDLLTNAVDTELWNQLSENNEAVPNVINEILPNSVEENVQNETIVIVENSPSRKRHKSNRSNSPKNVEVPPVAEKKRKRKKSSRDQSFTEYFFKPMSTELQTFYNNSSGDNEDLLEIQSKMPRNPNCWMILDADLRCSPKTRRRKVCPRCRTDSHIGKKCTENPKKPCCHMCGVTGHVESRCPQTMCLTCGRKYAAYRQTCNYCYKLHCTICNGVGHKCDNCPDLWRRYHITTTETKPVVPGDEMNIIKAPQNLTCCNCAKRGHDVTMCRQLRWSQHFPTPIHVSSYTKGPMYTIPNDETVVAVNSDREIEVLEPIGDENVLPNEHTNSASEIRVIFESNGINLSKDNYFHKISLRLDEMTNLYLNGLLTGAMKPTFLTLLKTSYKFNVRITHGPGTAVFLNIEANSQEVLNSLVKLLRQWLSRKDDEKSNLKYIDISGKKVKDGVSEAHKTWGIFTSASLQPSDIMNKIITYKNNVKREFIRKFHRKMDDNEKIAKKRFLEKSTMRLRKMQVKLVTTMYKRLIVEDADAFIRWYVRLMHSQKKPEFLTKNYLEFMYVYNEMFTFRTTEPLLTAFDKVLTKAEQSECFDITLDKSFNFNENTDEFKDKPLLTDTNASHNQICPVYYSPLGSRISNQFIGTDAQNSPILPNLMATGVPHVIPENYEGGVSANCLNETEMQFGNYYNQVAMPDDEETHNLSKSKAQQKNSGGGLLVDLSKKRRSKLRRSFKECIKEANKLQIRSLNAMVKVLKRKMYNESIHSKDIMSFRRKLVTLRNQQAKAKAKHVDDVQNTNL